MPEPNANDRDLPDSIHRCRLLVDGYNLLFALGLLQPRQPGHRALQRAREDLISKIATRVPSKLRHAVWVVFDALDAPQHLPRTMQMQGMSVHFSRGWISADEMLQAIIGQHSSPRSLWVISSDHAVQRKAIARGASTMDSEGWEQAVERGLRSSSTNQASSTNQDESDQDRGPKDQAAMTKEERNEWLRRFGFSADPES